MYALLIIISYGIALGWNCVGDLNGNCVGHLTGNPFKTLFNYIKTFVDIGPIN